MFVPLQVIAVLGHHRSHHACTLQVWCTCAIFDSLSLFIIVCFLQWCIIVELLVTLQCLVAPWQLMSRRKEPQVATAVEAPLPSFPHLFGLLVCTVCFSQYNSDWTDIMATMITGGSEISPQALPSHSSPQKTPPQQNQQTSQKVHTCITCLCAPMTELPYKLHNIQCTL